MKNILAAIVAQKQLEISDLYKQHDIRQLTAAVTARLPPDPPAPAFYRSLAAARARQMPFFIAEFKRKSPSEGWINQTADLPAQILAYTRAGAGAISVLTDTPFFGGSYADLALAAHTLDQTTGPEARPLLLQKDFLLDPIQLYLARLHGADLVLLIAAILEPERLAALRRTAESIGLGVLVEVHDRAELERIRHLDFPVLGINNRDLKTFRTALNRANVLARSSAGRFVIAESGVRDYRDFQLVRAADGFLIGTSLMREEMGEPFATYFQTGGRPLLKACGIRTPELLSATAADYLGINFSPVSRRGPDQATRQALAALTHFPARLVAVFYKNTEAEIRAVLAEYPFQTIQLYATDVQPDFVRSLRPRVWLACAVRTAADLARLEDFAADVDGFILDGAVPGSGQGVGAVIPADFPYPFLLAGGLHAGNLEQIRRYAHCIGVDIASGIETDGHVEAAKIRRVAEALADLTADEKIFNLAGTGSGNGV